MEVFFFFLTELGLEVEWDDLFASVISTWLFFFLCVIELGLEVEWDPFASVTTLNLNKINNFCWLSDYLRGCLKTYILFRMMDFKWKDFSYYFKNLRFILIFEYLNFKWNMNLNSQQIIWLNPPENRPNLPVATYKTHGR